MRKNLLLVMISLIFIFPCSVFAAEGDIVDYIKGLATDVDKNNFQDVGDNNLAYDGTLENNLRYVGKNPNNYIEFNDELWRIIGIINTSDGELVKLIRYESLGNYTWDSSDNSINSGQGINEWSTSNINKILNNAYLNKTSISCYVGIGKTSIETCDFSSNGLNDSARKLIKEVTWDLGSNHGDNYKNANAYKFYSYPTSGLDGKFCSSGIFCNDTLERTTTWTGYVGLIYPADYIFASSGDESKSRNVCFNDIPINSWDDDAFECAATNWLTTQKEAWTITPYGDGTYANTIFYTRNKIGMRVGYQQYIVRPVVYLDNDIFISSGDGSELNPYKIKKYEKVDIKLVENDTKSIKELYLTNFQNLVETDINLENVNVDDKSVIQLDGENINVNKSGETFISLTLNDKVYVINVKVNKNEEIKDKEISNPDTSDNIYLSFVLLLISSVGIFTIVKCKIK